MSDFKTVNDLIFCEGLSEIPSVSHCFTTRNGGVSKLSHTYSMNLGFGRGDPDEAVEENLLILRNKLSLKPSDRLVSAHQVHSDRVVYADGSVEKFDGADGFVTDRAGVYLLVKVADCQPILFADRFRGVVGACHAGWRGTAAGIAKKTVEMMAFLGAERKDIVAACGPCIKECCFEVGEDFVGTLEKLSPDLVKFVRRREKKIFADISGMNKTFLLEAGL
ncbi:MAG: peptidoglycan editing factor PgeF, partial [Clostridia bacterium]|nr:peptidoglycan editing factor PgeF [Clostridia bacterium]